MAVFPTHTFPDTEIKYRFGERYSSEATNKKFLPIPRGVYLGFTPSFSGNVLSLTPDSVYGVSLARLVSQDDPTYSIDVLSEETLTLDFTDHVTFPVNVVLKATGALGQPHTAEILAQVGAPVEPTEILLCVVSAAQTVVFDDPTNQTSPYAHASAPLTYGFMKDGAVEELLAGIALTSEIVDARTDLTGFTHPTLKARLDADATGPAMASRLGKEVRTIISEDVVLAAPATVVNVSRSFSAVHRTNSPLENIEPFGTEDLVGAITGGTLPASPPTGAATDSVRNVVSVLSLPDEDRLLDSTRKPVYGRITATVKVLVGTLQFTVGLPTVTGVGTQFVTQGIQAGDLVQDPNGNLYEVLTTPAIETSLTLSVNALATLAGGGLEARRFELSFLVSDDAGGDASFQAPAGLTIRFFFSQWRELDVGQVDYLVDLFANHEQAPIPSATVSTAGKAQVGANATGGQAGAILRIQQGGGQVGPTNIIGLDFNGATDAGAGVADISQRGPTGIPGPDGGAAPPGPVGPPGPTGQGYTVRSEFNNSGVFDSTVLGAGASYSHTVVFGGITDLLWLHATLTQWEVQAGFSVDNDDHFIMDDLVKVSGNTARLDARIPTGFDPTSRVRWSIGGSGI